MAPTSRKYMANETNNETANNMTLDVVSAVEESGLLEEPIVLGSCRSSGCICMLYKPSNQSYGNANFE